MVKLNIDSGKSCCFFVGTDCDGVTSEFCMIQNELHQDYQKDHPKETERVTGSASSLSDCQFKDGMEPSAWLIQCWPWCSTAKRTSTTGNHTGTKSSKEWRQVHDTNENTVQCADCNSKHYTEQHCYYYWNIVASYKCSADQCVTYHTSSD